VEKPDREAAAELLAAGALLSTFMFAAEARTLLQIYRATLPGLVHAFLERATGSREAREDLYATTPDADFSRDVLARAIGQLFLLRVPDCGWSDLGTPARIQKFVHGRHCDPHVVRAYNEGMPGVAVSGSAPNAHTVIRT
jgi:mannose-1-phosphate guanylyltransferase